MSDKKNAIKAGTSYYPAIIVEDWVTGAIKENVIEMSITELGKRGNVGYIGIDKKNLMSGLQWGMELTGVKVLVLDYTKKSGVYEIKHIPIGYTLKTAKKNESGES